MVVLAGGLSRRLGGGDKTLRALDGRPILAHVLDRLRTGHGPFAISANGDPARFAAFGCPVLPDHAPDLGPLAGILAAVDWAASLGAPHVLTVPGDAPFLPADLGPRLRPAPAFAASGGRDHPPVALWPTASAPLIRARLGDAADLARAARRVSDLGRLIGMRRAVWRDAPDGDPFADIDTPADLDRARARLAAARPATETPVR